MRLYFPRGVSRLFSEVKGRKKGQEVERGGGFGRKKRKRLTRHPPPHPTPNLHNRQNSSPFILATSDPQRELLDPAMLGTVNLLSSAAKESERRSKEDEGKGSEDKRRPLRVVLTSSVAAVHGEYEAPPKNGSLYCEEDWNVSLRSFGSFEVFSFFRRRLGFFFFLPSVPSLLQNLNAFLFFLFLSLFIYRRRAPSPTARPTTSPRPWPSERPGR